MVGTDIFNLKQNCLMCNGTGMVPIAPGARGIKVCPDCAGKKKPIMDVISKIEKPPIGITPEWIWIEQRVEELKATINRYWNAGISPDAKWVTELNNHLVHLESMRRKP